MATEPTLKQLLGSSDSRKQVSFNVQPLALTPTMQNGGNYPVFVADTTKWNQALELSENLKRIPSIFKSYTNIQETLGEQRGDLISGADAEEELKRLKKEEPETFWNMTRQKAYKDSLIEKHIRTEMVPSLINDLKNSANARKYLNVEDFNEAMEGQLSAAWQSFETSVGKDVANSLDGRTVWNGLTDNLRAEAQTLYFESQDTVALENDIDSIEYRVSNLLSPVDSAGEVKDINLTEIPKLVKNGIAELMNRNGLSRSESTGEMRKIMARRMEQLIVEGKNLLALDVADALDSVVSDDGVGIFKDNSETSLQIAKLVKTAHDNIEKLQDEFDKDNQISQNIQDIYQGEVLGALKYLSNGQRFSSLSDNQKQLVLLPLQNLDPLFTMEKLEEVMAPMAEGDAGGGLTEFDNLITGFSVGKSDYARQLIALTRSAVNRDIINASQIQGPPVAVRDIELQQAYEEKFKQLRMADPSLTEQQFLTQENIQPWSTLKNVTAAMESVNSVMQNPHYEDVLKNLTIKTKATLEELTKNETIGNIGPKGVTSLTNDFANQIKKVLIDEAEAGLLDPDDYEARANELIDIANQSIRSIITETQGGDILLEDSKVFDDEIANKEFEQTPISKDGSFKFSDGFPLSPRILMGPAYNWYRASDLNSGIEQKTVFKTNFSRLKEEQKPTGKKAFFFYPLKDKVMTPWSPEDIAYDRAQMIKGITEGTDGQAYRDALGYSLHVHGADIMENPEEAISMLEKSQLDAMDVSLFSDKAEIELFGEKIFDVYNKIKNVEKLTESEQATVEQARFLGLITERMEYFQPDGRGGNTDNDFHSRIKQFIEVQYELFKSK